MPSWVAPVYAMILHVVGLAAIATLMGTGTLSVSIGMPLLTGLLGIGVGVGVVPAITNGVSSTTDGSTTTDLTNHLP